MSQSNKKKNVLERMPQEFREQYFSLFAAPEPETIYPNLYQKLIDNGTDLILKQVKQYNEQRKELAKKVRSQIQIRQLDQDENLAKMRIVASDAGNNGVDLRSAFTPLYASTAIVAEGWKIVEEPICKVGDSALWSDEFSHNKTAFALRRLGPLELNRLKQLAKDLNRQLGRHPGAKAEKIMPVELSSCAGV